SGGSRASTARPERWALRRSLTLPPTLNAPSPEWFTQVGPALAVRSRPIWRLIVPTFALLTCTPESPTMDDVVLSLEENRCGKAPSAGAGGCLRDGDRGSQHALA